MAINGVNEKDWKLFRKNLPGWQEAYMEKLCKEYAGILSSSSNASDKFWELEKRINKDKNDTGVSARMSRSMMLENITSLLQEGAITVDDLDEFSEELIEIVKRWARIGEENE